MADLYSTLGVARGASEADIKKAYRKLAKELHPDKNKDNPKATERFSKVTQAYDILTDKDKRAQYDRGEIDEDGNPKMPFGFGGAGPGGGGAGRGGPFRGPNGEPFEFTGGGEACDGSGSQPFHMVGDPMANAPRTEEQWFDPSVVRPATGRGDRGNDAACNNRKIQLPGFHNHDVSFFKDFTVRGNQRITFKWEIANLFDQVSWQSVDTSGQLNPNTGEQRDNNFGRVTAARNVAWGMASEASSTVTVSPSRAAASDRIRLSVPPTSASSARSSSTRARRVSIRPSVSSRVSRRSAACFDQVRTSSMVSPYFRVSAVSAARRSETAASRAGSVSSPAA